MAREEGISLHQYIVYALTRPVTPACTVHPVPDSEVTEPTASYTALLQNVGQATFEEIDTAMDLREKATPQVVTRL